MRPVRILFFSSSSISLPLLEVLAKDSRFEVQAVICQPDKPAGRGQTLTPPPSKVLALQCGIPVFQPIRLKDADDLLERFSRDEAPDFLLTFAYGQILSQAWLELARRAPLNVHGSLLPLYRGASPIQSVLLEGGLETGLSLMKMEKTMDSGPVARTWALTISPELTADGLFETLARLAADRVPDALFELATLEKGALNAAFLPQEGAPSFCGKLTKEFGFEDFLKDAEVILRRYRALTSWPGLWTFWRGKRLKILDLKPARVSLSLPAACLRQDGERLYVGTHEGVLEILELQLEGKSKMSARDFLRGQLVMEGERLGEKLPSDLPPRLA